MNIDAKDEEYLRNLISKGIIRELSKAEGGKKK
jgi:hypothetical protein